MIGNNTLSILIFFFATQVFAADIDYSGKINVVEYEAKTIKSSWCIFSKGNSNTSNTALSTQLKGNENTHIETYSYRGTTYLKRKVEWKNEETKNSMILRFQAADSHFSGTQEFDETTCTYKTWMGESTSAETELKARAAFIIPKNVWAIKIQSQNDSRNGVSTFTLSNDDYQKTDNVLTKKELLSFRDEKLGRYFLVNPSFEGRDNFIYLDFKYSSRTLNFNGFNLSFKVEFIAQEQCLENLSGLDFTETLNKNLKMNHFENILTNMACMLNTNYVKHNLGAMHLTGLDHLFKKLDETKKEMMDKKDFLTSSSDIDALRISLKLMDRVRFYYSYEILKETMGLLLEQVSYDGKGIDAWLYLEVLRRRGVLYLADVFDNLSKTVTAQLEKSNSIFVEFSPQDKLKLDLFLNHILPIEFHSFAKAHELIYRPKYLALDSFEKLDFAVKNVLEQAERISSLSKTIFIQSKVTTAQLERSESSLKLMSGDLRFYSMRMEEFRLTKSDSTIDDLISARQELLSQMESIYQIHLVSLAEEVGTYFFRHFEDSEFKNISIHGKTYENVGAFIKDFKKLLSEVQ